MSYKSAKLIIITIFVVSLIANIVLCFLIKSSVWPENFNKLLVLILQVYSVHAAVLFTAFLKPGETETPVPVGIFVLASALSLVWNLLLTIRLAMFASAAEEEIKELFTFIQDVSSYGSFLIVGVLAYFFKAEPR